MHAPATGAPAATRPSVRDAFSAAAIAGTSSSSTQVSASSRVNSSVMLAVTPTETGAGTPSSRSAPLASITRGAALPSFQLTTVRSVASSLSWPLT